MVLDVYEGMYCVSLCRSAVRPPQIFYGYLRLPCGICAGGRQLATETGPIAAQHGSSGELGGDGMGAISLLACFIDCPEPFLF